MNFTAFRTWFKWGLIEHLHEEVENNNLLIYRHLFHNVRLWEKVFFGAKASHDGSRSCNSMDWPLCPSSYGCRHAIVQVRRRCSGQECHVVKWVVCKSASTSFLASKPSAVPEDWVWSSGVAIYTSMIYIILINKISYHVYNTNDNIVYIIQHHLNHFHFFPLSLCLHFLSTSPYSNVKCKS